MVRIISELIILGAVSIVVAFIVNSINPAGIPLFGQWDQSIGIVHAGGPCAPSVDQIDDIGAMDLYLNSKALFIDARSADDFSEGHIPRALNLPINDVGQLIDAFMEKWQPDTRLLIYCSGPDCHDSHDLAKILKEYGFQSVSVYSHGFDKWKNSGRPIEISEPSIDE
ncbi:rhodanese-like domain-containing protein [bacterium]|nr:rhodanese-like domain-containing protein [candidate division CSSED10-310 bacterium]